MRVLLAAVVLLLPLPAVADASWTAPCRPGGSAACTWWNAKVTLVADGDTLKVKQNSVRQLVRITGIDAMELTRYSRRARGRRGACHARDAAAFVDRYIRRGDVVRLAAQNPASRSGRRLRRSVWVRRGGTWLDLARLELEAGHVLWLPNGTERVHNAEYGRLAAAAIAAGRNLYDPDACGAGPEPAADIRVRVNWNARGHDARNPNGEWVDIRNRGTAPLDLSRWWVRDSALRYQGQTPGFRFPAGTVVAPDRRIRLRVGCGTRGLHWCLDEAVFENPSGPKGTGDGAYLFDPQGDLRAAAIYR